jgi:rhodanese-related sulfurtransferase
MSSEKVSTIGEQKKANYALREDMTQEEFVAEVLEGLESPLQYFGMNVAMNKSGYENVDRVIANGMKPLSPKQFEAAVLATDALILDTRDADDFAKGYIPGSINIGLQGMFAPWVGALIQNVDQPIALVCAPGTEKEAVTRLARVGFDHVVGCIDGGVDAWIQDDRRIETIQRLSANQLLDKQTSTIIDVRRSSEYAVGHAKEALHVALDSMNAEMDTFSPNESYILYCAGGYRSMIAASILKARGIKNVQDVIGGFAAMQKSQQIEENICPI